MIDTIFTSMEKDYSRVDFDTRDRLIEAVEWCQQYPSKGNFALGARTIYFENPEDAMMCTLRWVK